MRKPDIPARQLVFGLVDGSMSITGVVLYAAGHSELVLPVAISGGVSAAVSMAGGEWLSDSETGVSGAVAMGLATLTGSVLPAIPYAIWSGRAAPVVSVLALTGVTAVVARLRAHRRHPYLETAAVLCLVLAASTACALWL